MAYKEEKELIIEQIEIGPMQNFTYIVGSRVTREVCIVDPAWDIDGLLDRLAEKDYILTAALVTHYHPDHIGGSYSACTNLHGGDGPDASRARHNRSTLRTRVPGWA